MPLYDDPFAGHLELDDPRSPLFGAGGCTWPTIPAYRYIVCPAGTWGVFSGLDGVNIQLRLSVGQPAHNDCWWLGFNLPWPLTYGTLRKQWVQANNTQLWTLALTGGYVCGTVQWVWVRAESDCNVDHNIGAAECSISPPVGGFGSGTKLLQCEYDKTSRGDCVPPT